jgi:hypothetical protein
LRSSRTLLLNQVRTLLLNRVRTLLLNHYTTTEGMPELLIVAAEGNDTTKVRTLCWPYITALQLPQSKTIAKLIRNKKLKRC